MDKKDCLQLIELYGGYRRLWDAQCSEYTNRGLREDAWREIGRVMNMSVQELKKKMESLMGSYRRERSREKQSRITGSGMIFLTNNIDKYLYRIRNIHIY